MSYNRLLRGVLDRLKIRDQEPGKITSHPEGLPGPVWLPRHGRGYVQSNRRAASVGNAAEPVCRRKRTTCDGQGAIEEALKHPEQPLRRAVGTNEPFSLAPVALPTVPGLPRKPQKTVKPQASRPAPADRSKLDSAETLLRELETERRQEETELRREEDVLAQRRTAAQEAYVKDRKKANDAIEAARRDYLKAGGTD